MFEESQQRDSATPMNKQHGPIALLTGDPGSIILERRIEWPGVAFEICSCERLSSRRIFGSNTHHRITLALSQLPKDWSCEFVSGGPLVPVGLLNFLPAGCHYRLSARTGRHRWLNMIIEPDYIQKLAGQSLPGALKPIVGIQGTGIDVALFRIAREIEVPSFGSNQVIRGLTETLIIDLVRLVMGTKGAPETEQEGLTSEQLIKVSEFVEHADNISPTILDIANLLGLSRRHLTRMFRATVGQTIHSYVAEIRLRKAIGFLTASDLSVKEISHKLGFTSPWGLTAAFRAATGKTPSQFRRQHRTTYSARSAGQGKRENMSYNFNEQYERSLRDPSGFWAEAATAIDWHRPADTVRQVNADGSASWFVGAQLNTCWNAVDRHVLQGRGKQAALIYDSPLTGTKKTITYSDLRNEVAKLAGVLRGMGVGRGDRVLIYMPVILESAIAMLACARLGAIHSVVFGGFVARELASRISDAQPKVLIAASCGLEPGRVIPYKPAIDAAIKESSGSITHCIVFQRPQCPAELIEGRDFDWDSCMASAEPVDCVPVGATDPLYILYTSGTTGQPKGIVRPSGGHAVALTWSMANIFDVKPGDVFWAASDVGWVVGHSYMIYGPLLHGATSVMYEGKPVGTPDAGAFWRVIDEYKVSTMFVAPTAIRAIRQADPEGTQLKKHDLKDLRALFLAGERCDPSTLEWIGNLLDKPVIDNWWQTETGWPIAANPLGIELLSIKPGSVSRPMPGWDVRVVDADGQQVKPLTTGDIVCKLPLPPGAAITLWNAPDRYQRAYLTRYPGFYQTGDAGFIDKQGYLHVMTRTDDVINVAGHRLSTGAIEEVIASHRAVAECAVVGLDDDLKGQVPLGLCVLKSHVTQPHYTVIDEIIAYVRDSMGPIVAFKKATVVKRLPKTRSGKILRSVIANIANGKEFLHPATIEDPATLAEIAENLTHRGLMRRSGGGA